MGNCCFKPKNARQVLSPSFMGFDLEGSNHPRALAHQTYCKFSCMMNCCVGVSTVGGAFSCGMQYYIFKVNCSDSRHCSICTTVLVFDL